LGKDVSKLKAKGGKFKYMSENDMLELAAKFSPYRYVDNPSLGPSDVAHGVSHIVQNHLYVVYVACRGS
jgi:hypothetical protein